MSNLDRLRDAYRTEPGEDQFDALALRYRRLTRDYADVARVALSQGALWDGGGRGQTEVLYRQTLELEQKREGVRVSLLGDLLNAIEVGGEDPVALEQLALRFAEQHALSTDMAMKALSAELLRQYVIRAVSLLRMTYGNEMDPYGSRPMVDARRLETAQKMLRIAAELDRR